MRAKSMIKKASAALLIAAVSFAGGIATEKSVQSPVKVVDTTGYSESEYWDLIESRKGTILITKESYYVNNKNEGTDKYGKYVAPHGDAKPGDNMYMYCIWDPDSNSEDGILERFDYKAN